MTPGITWPNRTARRLRRRRSNLPTWRPRRAIWPSTARRVARRSGCGCWRCGARRRWISTSAWMCNRTGANGELDGADAGPADRARRAAEAARAHARDPVAEEGALVDGDLGRDDPAVLRRVRVEHLQRPRGRFPG